MPKSRTVLQYIIMACLVIIPFCIGSVIARPSAKAKVSTSQEPDDDQTARAEETSAVVKVKKGEEPALPDTTEPTLPKALAETEGIPSPGKEIVLHGEASVGAKHYLWIQTQGPTVDLGDPSKPTLAVTVPERASLLAFSLFVANDLGTDVTHVVVRVTRPNGVPAPPNLRADAGDDQVGIVGRQITLNGSRSEPRGQVGYRWMQSAGPRVRLDLDDGYVYSFVPQAPGIYEFGLVVALGNQISEPDKVVITVGNAASPYRDDPRPDAPETLSDVAGSALSSVPGGLEMADPLGEAFDGVADRMDLYASYADAYAELSTRLDLISPSDAARRGVWNDRLFAPLTARLVVAMRVEGLDVRVAGATNAPMTSSQRATLAELFRMMSRGFRASLTRPRP